MSTMEVGSVRYGMMCTDEGVVFDDGVVARLEPDRFLITTTSGGAAEVGEWIENWLQRGHPEWRVHVTPMTAAFASINVAGPNSRDLLVRLTTGVDLDAAAFPYMRIRIGTIAGVEGCYIMKIGFTGELSYEIHAPASYGLFLWEKMLEVGNDLGVQPFGVEAQRILRLEKGHPIIGQDTNALTPAITMGTVSRTSLRKPDFVGKPEIEWRSKTADYPRLVGLQPADSSIVPPEACQIVDGSRIVGRITSSCMSPILGRPICLAEVVPNLATPGTTVSIRLINGKLVAATVTAARGQFDPKGTRLHG
jgi:sarcosine oxidase subunit alpha